MKKKTPKLSDIVYKFAPKGTMVKTYEVDDILIIRKVGDYTYTYKYKKK